MTVRYIPVRGRTCPFYSVHLIDLETWHVGFVHLSDQGWIARRRGDTADKFSPPWSDRTAAATWLLLTAGFAQKPPMQVAA